MSGTWTRVLLTSTSSVMVPPCTFMGLLATIQNVCPHHHRACSKLSVNAELHSTRLRLTHTPVIPRTEIPPSSCPTPCPPCDPQVLPRSPRAPRMVDVALLAVGHRGCPGGAGSGGLPLGARGRVLISCGAPALRWGGGAASDVGRGAAWGRCCWLSCGNADTASDNLRFSGGSGSREG